MQFVFNLASFSRFSSKWIHNNGFNFVQNFAKSFVYSSLPQSTTFSNRFSSSSKLLRPLIPPPVETTKAPSPRSREVHTPTSKYDTWDASIRAKLAIDGPAMGDSIAYLSQFLKSSLGYSSSITRVCAWLRYPRLPHNPRSTLTCIWRSKWDLRSWR